MAIDTPKKRKSAAGVPQPETNVPLPDGTIDALDRATLSGVYLPAAASVIGGLGYILFGDEDCWTFKART